MYTVGADSLVFNHIVERGHCRDRGDKQKLLKSKTKNEYTKKKGKKKGIKHYESRDSL